ncbi:hypothetical protein T4D_14201, partial [Trichinella pseudospiralis]
MKTYGIYGFPRVPILEKIFDLTVNIRTDMDNEDKIKVKTRTTRSRSRTTRSRTVE